MRLFFLILAVMLIVPATAAKPEKAKKSAAKDSTQKEIVNKEAVKEIVKETLAEETAAKKNEDEIKVNAILEVGIDINNKADEHKTNRNKIGYGKIEISARPVKKVRAEFGFEYDNSDSSLIIDKLYGQYNISEFGSFRVGYMKKAFGFEEKSGLDERYFHKRSIINDSLERFNLLGHDLTLQYRHKLNENWRLVGAFSYLEYFSLGKGDYFSQGEDANSYYQNYSVEYETPNINLILAGIVGHYTLPDYNLTAWVTSLSFRYLAKHFVSETEATFGNDPIIKLLDKENAFVLGIRVQEYFPINTGLKTLRQVIPIAEVSYYSKDIGDNIMSNFDAQARVGLTFGFAKNSAFQWRNTYGQVLRIRDDNVNTHRRRFDSEVVVIF